MPIFKYTVANKEGKKLSGNVEAPDEKTARAELNNLGFSIIDLKEVKKSAAAPKDTYTGIKFVFEAIDKNSRLISGTIPAENQKSALTRLKKEYELTVTAIWKEGSSEEQVAEAKKQGSTRLQNQVKEETTEETTEETKEETTEIVKETKPGQEKEEGPIKTQEQIRQEAFTKVKIERILAEVHELLQKFDKNIAKDQKAEINKKIDKLLRIKNSTNIEYILATAESLLNFIRGQETDLKEKGLQEERFELRVETSNMLGELKKTSKASSLSEDILKKITIWQKSHSSNNSTKSKTEKTINKFLNYLKVKFKTPQTILVVREEIRLYDKQLWDFTKLYFKEPTPEYKNKVKNSLKTVWEARKKAKAKIREIKKGIKQKKESIESIETKEELILPFVKEINALSGWLLTFYITYYFASLYLSTKDFGFVNIPKGFIIYESQLFKYVLVILFLFHMSSSIKVNYFKNSKIADIVLPVVFIFGSIITLLNF